jgi:hypothetical protein
MRPQRSQRSHGHLVDRVTLGRGDHPHRPVARTTPSVRTGAHTVQHLHHVAHQTIRPLARTRPPRPDDRAQPTRPPDARPRHGPAGRRCSITIVPTPGSHRTRTSCGASPAHAGPTPDPPSPTLTASPAHHVVTRPACAPGSGRWSGEDTRTYTTIRPDMSPTATSTTIVPTGKRRAGTGIRSP